MILNNSRNIRSLFFGFLLLAFAILPHQTHAQFSPYDISIPRATALPTRTPVPTRTFVPTRTSVPTRTFISTRTSVPTRTFVPSRTPAFTPTNFRTVFPTRTSVNTRTPFRTPVATTTSFRTAFPTRTFVNSRTPSTTRTPLVSQTPTATSFITRVPFETLTPAPTVSVTAEPGESTPSVEPTTPSDQVAISTFLECVQPMGNGMYVAYFGYENYSGYTQELSSGWRGAGIVGRFTQGTSENSQPTLFQPGRVYGAYAVQFNGSEIEWRVGPPEGGIISVKASRNSASCKPVAPIFECLALDQSIGKYYAVFGYQNDNPFDIDIPVGKLNTFLPAPADRGQPAKFFTGRVNNAFRISLSDRKAAAWSLMGRTAVIPKNAKRCGTEPLVVDGISFSSMVSEFTASELECAWRVRYESNCRTGRTQYTAELTDYWPGNTGYQEVDYVSDCPGFILQSGNEVPVRFSVEQDKRRLLCNVRLAITDGILVSACERQIVTSPCDPSAYEAQYPNINHGYGSNYSNYGCLQIETSRLRTDLHATLDSQVALMLKAVRSSKATNAARNTLINTAGKLLLDTEEAMAIWPSFVLSCEDPFDCTRIDISYRYQLIQAKSSEIYRLTVESLRRQKDIKRIQRLLSEARVQHEAVLSLLAAAPRFESKCR